MVCSSVRKIHILIPNRDQFVAQYVERWSSIAVQLNTSSSTLNERSISSKIDKSCQTLIVYSSKTMHQISLKFSVNVPAMVFCSKLSTQYIFLLVNYNYEMSKKTFSVSQYLILFSRYLGF